MDTTKLKKMIEMVRESGIAELEISDGQEKIRITNTFANNQPLMMTPLHQMQQMGNAPAGGNDHNNGNGGNINDNHNNNNTPAPVVIDPHKIIKSPMVGTFYRSTVPGGKPLIDVGQKIKKGDVLCIIEAMKLMNEIESEYDGVIKEVVVPNEHPVEFGEPLFILE